MSDQIAMFEIWGRRIKSSELGKCIKVSRVLAETSLLLPGSLEAVRCTPKHKLKAARAHDCMVAHLERERTPCKGLRRCQGLPQSLQELLGQRSGL